MAPGPEACAAALGVGASTLEGLEWEAEMLRAPGELGEAAPPQGSCGH